MASVTALVFAAVERPPAPSSVPTAPLGPALTRHLLLVVVDGLRYDVATNAQLMPEFSRAMHTRTSAEIWAGRVSMTSSAVLAYGTGQRGRLDQVLLNLNAGAPPYNSWLRNARARGLSLCAVGDPAWFGMYPQELDCHRNDPDGVAIDVDFNPQTFRGARELAAKLPHFLVVHFVTPDHQGHAYGIRSARYAAHIRDFDGQLQRWLAELPDVWTVVVTSDHGAADSGTHGTDVAVQRRSPIYAYGPGIEPRTPLTDTFEQVDLAATLPVLLGVAPPAHGTGRVMVEWLSLAPAERAAIACANAERTVHYAERVAPASALRSARAELAACSRSEVEPRLGAAERAIRAADAAVSEATGLSAPNTRNWLLVVLLSALGLAYALLGRLDVKGLLFGLAIACCSVALVALVERLPGVFPNVVRVALFVAANLLLCALLLRPAAVLAGFERSLPFGAGIVPGALACTYPANVRPQAYVVVALLVSAYCLWPQRFALAPRSAGVAATSRAAFSALALSVLLLLPVALREDGTYSSWIAESTRRALAASLLLVAWACWQAKELRLTRARLPLLVLFSLAPLWLARWLPPWAGRGAWLACAALLLALIWRQRYRWALVVGAVSVLWVSREFEVAPLLATLTLSGLLGRVLAERNAPLSTPQLLLVALLGLALGCVLRIGIQDGLDFGGMDWRAGAFGDPAVPEVIVGSAIAYKYFVAGGLVVLGLCHALDPAERGRVSRALVLSWLARCAALAAMFVVAGNSFWTAMRVLGALPAALALTCGSFAFAELLGAASARSTALSAASRVQDLGPA